MKNLESSKTSFLKQNKPHVTQRKGVAATKEDNTPMTVAEPADNEILNNIDAISNILNKQFFNNDLNDQSSNQNSSVNSDRILGGSKKSSSKPRKFKSKLIVD